MKIGDGYVQFSKIIVVLVVVSVTIMAGMGMKGMLQSGDFTQINGLFAHYMDFASIVFVAYSGNSVAEKWLAKVRSGDMSSRVTVEEKAEG